MDSREAFVALDLWKVSKLPLATIFKPQRPYVSTLLEKCRELPKNAVDLLETLLSIEPQKRRTASDALDSEYFFTSPYACDPSSLPKYPPNKEFDAKIRDEARRKKAILKARASATFSNRRRSSKTAEGQESIIPYARKNSGGTAHIPRSRATNASRESINSSHDTSSEASQKTRKSQEKRFTSGPLITPSSGYVWAKQPRRNNRVPKRYHSQVLPKSQNIDDLERENKEVLSGYALVESAVDETYEEVKRSMRGQKRQSTRPDAFDASYVYDSPEFSVDQGRKQGKPQLLSGPLLPLPNTLDEDQDQDSYYLSKPDQRSHFHRD